MGRNGETDRDSAGNTGEPCRGAHEIIELGVQLDTSDARLCAENIVGPCLKRLAARALGSIVLPVRAHLTDHAPRELPGSAGRFQFYPGFQGSG